MSEVHKAIPKSNLVKSRIKYSDFIKGDQVKFKVLNL